MIFKRKDQQLEKILPMTARGRKDVGTQWEDWVSRSLPAGSPVSRLDWCPALESRDLKLPMAAAREKRKERCFQRRTSS